MQVDGKTNTKLQTVQFERFPVRCAHFSHDGSQFLVGSQHHGHFYVYDMMEGRSIKVPINHSSEITNMKVCFHIYYSHGMIGSFFNIEA